MNRHVPLAPTALILALAGKAFAACTINPIVLPLHYRVGADPQACQYGDIQSAIDAVGECPTIIDITREHLYTHQHLGIADKANLTLQGWGDGVTCADVPGPFTFPPYAPPEATAPLVTITGSSDGGGSVLYVTGTTHLSVRNLTISGGLTCSGCSGGGIYFSGQGSLALTRSTISFNESGYGAGIEVDGSSGPATLALGSDTLVLSNTADTSGGGLRIEGDARLYALERNTLVAYNHAPNGYGGGLEVLGPARADIGSSGYNGLGVIYGNDAAYGGGVDILNFGDSAEAIVRVFTTDPAQPVQIAQNFASHTGGAFYLRPYEALGSAGGGAVLCAYDFRIEGNAAQEGAAIYADADYDGFGNPLGGAVAFNANPAPYNDPAGRPCVKTEPPTALGAVACAADSPCNTLAANKTEDAGGNPTGGSIILMQNAAQLVGDRVNIRHNTGAHLLRQIGDIDIGPPGATLTNCLLADNTLSGEVIAQTDGEDSVVTLASCTIAGNSIGAPYAFLAPGALGLYDSIIDQPGRATADPAISSSGSAQNVLSNDRSTLPDRPDIREGEPSFVDAVHGDYHLTHASLGVDFAQPNTYTPHADLDRKPRVVDLVNVPDQYGPMDLGAYEIQPACSSADMVFCDGFDLD